MPPLDHLGRGGVVDGPRQWHGGRELQQDAAQRPHVHAPPVRSAVRLLGREVEGSALGPREAGRAARARRHSGHAEVGQLDVLLGREEHVGGLHITVNDLQTVQVLKGGRELPEDAQSHFFRDAGGNEGLQAAATSKFHDEQEHARRAYNTQVPDLPSPPPPRWGGTASSTAPPPLADVSIRCHPCAGVEGRTSWPPPWPPARTASRTSDRWSQTSRPRAPPAFARRHHHIRRGIAPNLRLNTAHIEPL
mmetsp:Transcript_40385/g.108386  ORF Transcript_40385/g.108386 Transcript_40385/m.108386 type:complete len:249 (+) Transcript_40385:374-1120(+)